MSSTIYKFKGIKNLPSQLRKRKRTIQELWDRILDDTFEFPYCPRCQRSLEVNIQLEWTLTWSLTSARSIPLKPDLRATFTCCNCKFKAEGFANLRILDDGFFLENLIMFPDETQELKGSK